MDSESRITGLAKMCRWETPHGVITAIKCEEYIGLRMQIRVILVDNQGRLYHYDRDEATQLDA